ncbi:MAG: hypothetical protein JWR72_2689 [Flavisolibacter sp.]|jgi:uncharacterized protein (DUF2141 family)|nr:hypothetical protein [Flavisolibacter sp.]
MGLLIYLLLAGAIKTQAQNKIIVEVSNFENNKGVCVVGLYNNNIAFSGKGEPVKKLLITPVNNSATAVFDNVEEGTYAVSVIHDANKNNKFDTNFLGIPTEGYGASKNKLPFASAPKFEANKFIVAPNSTSTVNIKLRYLF